MNEKEYLHAATRLMLAAAMIDRVDLEQFLRCTESFEGMLVQDTWTGTKKTHQELLEIARSAQRFKNASLVPEGSKI